MSAIVKTLSNAMCICLALTISACGNGTSKNAPGWVSHYQAAEQLWMKQDLANWDREAKLVLADSNHYGGSMPPAEPISSEQKILDTATANLPVQDRGETTTYSEALRDLGRHYRQNDEWEDAEKFYRKAYELEVATEQSNPKIQGNSKPNSSDLIEVLEHLGKTKDALDLENDAAKRAEKIYAEHNKEEYYLSDVYRHKAKAFEIDGKLKDAEDNWKKLLNLHSKDVDPANLAEIREVNSKVTAKTGGGRSPNILRELENLAEFYHRSKNSDGEEKTRLKILSIQQDIWPKDSRYLETPLEKVVSYYELKNRYDLAQKYLEDLTICRNESWNWERLSTALAEQKKYDQAIDAMKKAVSIMEAKNVTDNTASIYIRYSKLLMNAGKREQGKALRAKARELAPNIKNSTLRWH